MTTELVEIIRRPEVGMLLLLILLLRWYWSGVIGHRPPRQFMNSRSERPHQTGRLFKCSYCATYAEPGHCPSCGAPNAPAVDHRPFPDIPLGYVTR